MRLPLTLTLALLLAACPTVDDDDSSSLDDDDTTGADDDDSVAPDDDDSGADDDDVTDDDDASDDDDSSSPDDDDSVDDDDAGPDDDDSSSDDDDDDVTDDDDSTSDCADRTGGAMIDLLVHGEPFTMWHELDAFIDGAIGKVGTADNLAMFPSLVMAADCDPAWSFHPPVAQGDWMDSPPFSPHCDAAPSTIEGNPSGWNTMDDSWCPLVIAVVAVDDRR